MTCPSYAVFLCAALAAVCVGHSFGEYFQSSPRSDDAEYRQKHESNEQKFDPDSSARLELLEALVAEAENKSSSDASDDNNDARSSLGSGTVSVYDYGRNTGAGGAGGVGSAGGDAGTGSKGSTNDGGEDNTNNNAGGSNQTPKETADTTQTTDSTEATAGAGSNSKAEDGAAAVLSSGAAWFNIIMVLARGS
ncbi:hypothetical protein ERJ75_000072400 [Trypanosoma vivax]|nr:hypothetical protein ERJ75_000072400 [Trypanosoma vivax]